MSTSKPAVGDYYAFSVSGGFAHLQFTHKHKVMGWVVHVMDGVSSCHLAVEQLAVLPLRYTLFFHVPLALRHKFLTKVGNAPVRAAWVRFPVFRSGIPKRGGDVREWWFWDGDKEWFVGALNESQRHVPVKSAWSLSLLVERFEDGWTPSLTRN